jgi:uncharacterized membrane protein
METALLVVLLGATLTTGLVSGLFYAFSIAVMPALRGAGDRTLVDVMQRINTAILNGWFLIGYVGALLLTAAAAGLSFTGGGRELPVATGAALLAYLAAVALTARVNIPLNQALESAGHADSLGDPAAARTAFEARWVRANHLRTLLCTTSFALLCWSLTRL